MPATVLTPVTTTAHGTLIAAPVAVDGTNGNKFANPTGRAIIEITNGAASPITVTFVTVDTYKVEAVTYAVADDAQTLTNATTRVFGPFKKKLYNDASGDVTVTFSSGTTITARVLELGTS